MIEDILREAINRRAEKVIIAPGSPIVYAVGGSYQFDDKPLPLSAVEAYRMQLCSMSERKVSESPEQEFIVYIQNLARFRVLTVLQRGSVSMFIHPVVFGIPNAEDCHIPDEVVRTADLENGIVLIGAPSKAGRSTTISCIVNEINETKNSTVIMVADKITYLHKHKKSIVLQREIGIDTGDHVTGVEIGIKRSADVITLSSGWVRHGLKPLVEAAEAGCLVIASVNVINLQDLAYTLADLDDGDRYGRRFMRALRLAAVQRLITLPDGRLMPNFSTIAPGSLGYNSNLTDFINCCVDGSLIRSFDNDLYRMYALDLIDADVCLRYAENRDAMRGKLV